MTVPVEESDQSVSKQPRKTIEEILAEVGSKPVEPDDPVFNLDPFGSDEEVEAFTQWLSEERRKNVM